MPQFDLHFLTPLVFWSIVSFGLLLFLLYRYALPAILEILEAREKSIREGLEQAERLKKEASSLLAQYEARLKAVHQEAEVIIEQAKAKAQQFLEENEKRMKLETKRMLAEAEQRIEAERQKAVQEVRSYVVDLTILAVEKVLERNLTEADHRRLVEEVIQGIGEHPRRS